MDRDSIIAQHIFDSDNISAKSGNKKFLDLPLISKKRYIDNPKDSISLVICPSWGNMFPPYNLSRLSSVLRENKYDVNVFDLNINSYHFLKNDDIDYWFDNNYYMWVGDEYYKYLHSNLKPILDKGVQEILDTGDDIVGFTLYETNYKCTEYVIKKLKEANSDLTIIAGGPETISKYSQKTEIEILNSEESEFLDYIVIGEGETHILSIMEDYKNNFEDIQVIGDTFSKLDLNILPFPDYSDYNFNYYKHKTGVSLETSRGCVASCTFCTETLFWKFRDRESSRLIEEIKYQIKNYGVGRFWCIDSLVNGNLEVFHEFISDIVKNNLTISWNGYARCDGRMDKDFFKLIKESGCTSLSFGVESGSPLVLLDMKKNINPIEIIKNLKYADDAELFSHVNWIVGFPTETLTDSYHSLILLFICRKWIHSISPGMGLGIGTLTDIEKDKFKYNISDTPMFNTWLTYDFKNIDTNRILRIIYTAFTLKLFGIDNSHDRTSFLDKCIDFKPKSFDYKVEYLNQEFINFEVLKSEASINGKIESVIITSLANEYIMLSYFLYQIFGDFELKISLDNDILKDEFGDRGQFYSADVFIKVCDNKMEYKIIQEMCFSDEDVMMYRLSKSWKKKYEGIIGLDFDNIEMLPHVNYEHKVPEYLDFGGIDFENL
jgi:hypothetical protein|tara:strand:- start:65 stop:2050 length:1986 start_codon:yes stop_codon:yes gene_type:complete